jgi:putative flippase GtrA
MAFKRLYDGLSEGQQQFLKFSFVGGVGFVIDAGTFTILTKLAGLDLVTGRVISSLVFGMTSTYLLNRYLTFSGQRSGSIFSEYLRFAAANIIGNSLNIGTHALLVENLALFHRLPILGIVAGTAVGLVFNFTGSKYFVFRVREGGGAQ